jgi:hypothetical protein
MFKSLTKIEVSRPTFKKENNTWIQTGEEIFELIAFGDVATALMMESAGVVIDVTKGRIKSSQNEAKNGKVYTNYSFIINEYVHNTEE